MYIKVCGIKRVEDAVMCYEAGATAIGCIIGAVFKTSDEVPVKTAKEIFNAVPDTMFKVVVTHITHPEVILYFIENTGCNAVQLHSYIPLENVETIKNATDIKLIGLVHGNDPRALERVDLLVNSGLFDMIVVDTKSIDRVGGTGITHDWNVTRGFVEKYPQTKFVLAGGLTLFNVSHAVSFVRPYGVDVNSGTKSTDGYKDRFKVSNFVSSAMMSFNLLKKGSK